MAGFCKGRDLLRGIFNHERMNDAFKGRSAVTGIQKLLNAELHRLTPRDRGIHIDAEAREIF